MDEQNQDETPLLTLAAEREAEAVARRRAIADRCQATEKALDDIGFAEGCVAWRVALLVARVAGWQTLDRQLIEIARDPDVDVDHATPKASREAVRRAIRELEAEGLVDVEKVEGPPRRRARGRVVYRLTLRRSEIVDSGCQQSGQQSRQQSGQQSGQQNRQQSGQQSRQQSGQQLGQRAEITPLYIPLDPRRPLSPGKTGAGSVDVLEVGLAEVEPVVRRLVRALRLDRRRGGGRGGGDVETLWRTAAAHVAGLVDEASIATAARRARENARVDRVGYFRSVLWELLETDRDGLRRVLTSVSLEGGFSRGIPSERPSGRQGVEAARIRRPPDVGDADQTRRRLLEQLVEVEADRSGES